MTLAAKVPSLTPRSTSHRVVGRIVVNIARIYNDKIQLAVAIEVPGRDGTGLIPDRILGSIEELRPLPVLLRSIAYKRSSLPGRIRAKSDLCSGTSKTGPKRPSAICLAPDCEVRSWGFVIRNRGEDAA